jgi:hypothetical protein
MSTAHHMLHGAGFHSGSFYQREARHRRIIISKCAPTMVSPQELADTINQEGAVEPHKAAELIRALIARAHDEAVGLTLGIIVVHGQPE